LEGLWTEIPQLFSTACVSHILTPLEAGPAAAEAAAARVNAGEDFAAVAEDVSIDTGSPGGVLLSPETGLCDLPLGIVVPEFGYEASVAPIGEVHGPFETDFGWHIIVVSERTGPESLAALQADPDSYLTDDIRTSLVNSWVTSVIEGAEVDVDPEIGSWDPEINNIVPTEDG
jgi:peptidyl-prolyl cis-trans isomerase C